MASRAPPIPPAQRSSPGDKPHLRADGMGRHASAKDQGRGTQQNTHHSHQQDR